MCKSEVAQLRQQIELEMDAMRSGLHGVAQGTARHAFIHARMERIGAYQESLASQVGTATAHHIMCQLYVQTMEQGTAFDTTPS
jgi:hypothetical protein